MIKIVSFTICPFVQRVTALLEAKEVPYEVEFISLSDKPEWFLAISPTGQVPVLITEDGQALFESEAIVEYLDEVYPRIEGELTPVQRALDRAWGYLAAKNYLVQCSAQRSKDRETLLERSEKLSKAFKMAEQGLNDGPFFKGKSLSNIDIAWLPLLHRASLIEQHSGYDFIAAFPKVKAWQQQLLSTGLAEKSVADNFVEKFTGFYLSSDTCLGGASGDKNCNADDACTTSSCC